MAQPYYDKLTQLSAAHAPDQSDTECKHFFSGAALYSGGLICASLSPVGLAFKLPEHICCELLNSGVAVHLKYFEKAPIKKGYVLFPNFEDLSDRRLAKYFGLAIKYIGEKDN